MKSASLAVLALLLVGCGSKPAAETNKGPVTMTPEDLAAKLDMPLYPGATPVGTQTIAPFADQQGEMRYHLTETTTDSIDKIVAFYKSKTNLEISRSGSAAQLIGRTPHGNFLMIKVGKVGNVNQIAASAIAAGPDSSKK